MPPRALFFIGSKSRFSLTILALLDVMVLSVTACSQQPEAASNELFSPTQAFGPSGPELVAQQPSLNDVMASRVLSSRERAQVWAALGSVVSGKVVPLEPAKYGMRFSDVPRAVVTAASEVEMAVLSTQHHWPRVSVDYTDRDGYQATLEVDLDGRSGVISVTYRVPNESSRLARAEVLAAMSNELARIDTLTSENVLASATNVLSSNGAEVLETQEFPERYQIDLLMLDSQPAGLEATRIDTSEVLQWRVWAGVFPRKEPARELGRAFESAMRAWGSVPEYVQGD